MKEFFEAFSIKKVRECELRDECFLGFAHTCDKCDIYGQAYEVYPPITSDIVLGLFKILQKAVKLKYPKTIALEINIDKDFREEVLYGLIQLKNETFDQVRALFNAK